MKYINLFENHQDYSGDYSDLYGFIWGNNLQKHFSILYNIPESKWEDYTRGELGYDEEVMQKLTGDDYKIFYDGDIDTFKVSKKKKNIDKFIEIKLSSNKKVLSIIEEAGIFSEFPIRFEVLIDGVIVGGSTYHIEEDVYNFDIGILGEYQSMGIGKKLIDAILQDAKLMNCLEVKAQVINNELFQYFKKIGFYSSNDSGIKYVYKNI